MTETRPVYHADAAPVPAIVLDPFCGSGTTLMVARQLGRVGLGFDLLCNFRGGSPVFLEVKRPASRADLTDSECRARDHWGAAWHVVTTLDEALAALGAI